MRFTLTPSARYRAAITLGFFEKFASNDMIAGKLGSAGFTDVLVTGSGSERVATGAWAGPVQAVDLPDQITRIEVIKS